MNGLDQAPMAPQTYFYGFQLEAGKTVVFNPEDDNFEHQLDLRMACVDPSTPDVLHMVEVDGKDEEGQKITAALVSLKPSVLPSVCLGGFTITPPAIFRLKSGAGPIHISGQHLVMVDAEEFSSEEDDDEEDEEMLEVATSKKRAAPGALSQQKKKMKMDLDDLDDDEDDDEDDDDDDDDDDEEDESEEEESPVKPKKVPAKKAAPAQNGKNSKVKPPAEKTMKKAPKGKGPKSPKTPPKTPLTVPEVKTKLAEALKRGKALPKTQSKFENFLKNDHKNLNPKEVAELWKWRQTADAK